MSKVVSMNIDKEIEEEIRNGEISLAEDKVRQGLDAALWDRDRAMHSLKWDLQNLIYHTAEIVKVDVKYPGSRFPIVRAAEERGLAKHKFELAMHRFEVATEKLWKAVKECKPDKEYIASHKLEVSHPNDMEEFHGT